MNRSKKKNPTIRFLIRSFIGLLLFSIAVFTLLGIYMNRQSRKTIHEIGEIYMSGMNKQMSRHFKSVIKLRFDQMDGLVSVVSSKNHNKKSLYKELVYRAKVRDFNYLAICSNEGNFETLYGDPIHPINPKPFVKSLKRGERRVV